MLLLAGGSVLSATPQPPRLKLIQIGTDSNAFSVTATLIVGEKESLLWDAQYFAADARRIADAIQASGTHLKAILISHPDEDHIYGLAAILERFPGTPVYISAAGLKYFQEKSLAAFKAEKARAGPRLADSLPTPAVLPGNRFTIDGAVVEVIPDLTGDIIDPTNSALWIPSLKTVLAGDIVFNGVHVWLGSSDSTSRAAWRASLQRLANLKPVYVVAGHKHDINAPDDPAVLQQMMQYLSDFDAFRMAVNTPKELRQKMIETYSTLAIPQLMSSGVVGAMLSKTYGVQKLAPPAAGSNTPFESGTWVGSFTNQVGDPMPVTYEFGIANGVNTLLIGIGGRSRPASDVLFDGATLSFTVLPLKCVLKKKPEGSFVGTCSVTGPPASLIEISGRKQ